MDHLQRNRAAYNRIVERGAVFAKVATDEECKRPLAVLDSRGWLPKSVAGMKVLCLAAGGGWQSVLYAMAGADVTVVDLSPKMLDLDRREAERRGLQMQIIEASMDDLACLLDEHFEIVHHPVSTCYVPDLQPVFSEISRVLKLDGIYISQHKTPISLQVTGSTKEGRYEIGVGYYHQGALPPATDTTYREEGAVEYLHRYEQIVGGICEAGMVVEAFSEPKRAVEDAAPGSFQHRGQFVPPYLRLKAKKVRKPEPTSSPGLIWTPDS